MKVTTPSHQEISQQIYFMRGHRVMIDSDLADLYEVETKNLNKAVKRNLLRFPEDFMFQLTQDEFDVLKSQIATSKNEYGGRRYLPYVFTEHGVTMLASVLNSERAIQVNVAIVRAFVKLRSILETHKDLASKLNALERKYDHQFKAVFDAIRQLMTVGSPLAQKRIKGLNDK
jgi:phage regulator Rha-like protein